MPCRQGLKEGVREFLSARHFTGIALSHPEGMPENSPAIYRRVVRREFQVPKERLKFPPRVTRLCRTCHCASQSPREARHTATPTETPAKVGAPSACSSRTKETLCDRKSENEAKPSRSNSPVLRPLICVSDDYETEEAKHDEQHADCSESVTRGNSARF